MLSKIPPHHLTASTLFLTNCYKALLVQVTALSTPSLFRFYTLHRLMYIKHIIYVDRIILVYKTNCLYLDIAVIAADLRAYLIRQCDRACEERVCVVYVVFWLF